MKDKLIILILFISNFIVNGQEQKASFGIQYKPIVPLKYFNSSHQNSSQLGYNFKLSPRYSNTFGMIIRYKINKTFWFENALNYTNRNYKLELRNQNININDYNNFNIRSYEIPLQVLTYIRISNLWFVNAAFGASHTILASDVQSYGDNLSGFKQNFYRKSGGYRALLANLGMEYRNQTKGHYYAGISLHFPFSETGRIYPEFSEGNDIFNDGNFNEKFFIEVPGSYVTLDLRYFFPN